MPKKEFTGGSDDFAFVRTLDGHRALKNDSPMSRMSPEEVAADISDRRSLSTSSYQAGQDANPEGKTKEGY